MDELELKSIIESELNNTIGYNGGKLSEQRQLAMEYYYGEPFGDETEGRSQVVITEVADCIGWILPSLMEVFGGTDQAVRFDPVNAEDEIAADMETQAVNHVFFKQNGGFLLMHHWFFDALLQKNGYVKVWWDETLEKARESYYGLTDQQMAMLVMDDPTLEPVEHEQYSESIATEDGSVESTLHNITLLRTNKKGRICVENIPPEEIFVSAQHRNLPLEKCPFVAQVSRKTRSELVANGYDREMVDGITTTSNWNVLRGEQLARYSLDEEVSFETDTINKSMQEIWVSECYLRVDWDNDGVAELRKITMAGDTIIDNEPIDAVRIYSLCPMPIPHKHYGVSEADLVMDLQQLKSNIARNILDNFYFINNQRTAISLNVNIDDMMSSRPGGFVRTQGIPAQDVYPIPTVSLGDSALNMLGWVDGIRETRTGVSKNYQGLNDNIAGDTAHGLERVMTASEQKIKLIARIFAETGVKDMFLGIHALLRKYGHAMQVKLKDKWQNIDPREWVERDSMTPKVGLGTGDRSKLQGAILSLQTLQQQLLQISPTGVIVNYDNIYNAAIDFARYSGLPSPDQYFSSPQSEQAQQILNSPPPEDPNDKFMQLQAQIEQLKAQVKGQEMQYKYALEQQKIKADYDLKNAEIERKYEEMTEKARQFYTEAELKYKQNIPGSAV